MITCFQSVPEPVKSWRPGMADTRKFANWLAATRKSRDISQEILAEAAGVTQEYISGLERGVRNPSKKMVIAAAAALAPDDADEHSQQELLNAGLWAAGLAPTNEVEYELDPDIQMIVEAYSGGTDRGKRAIKSAAELALEMSRENSIGKRAK